ncbi:MAG: hypothetical protein Q9191_001256 [Dirinaria sp. TL-2023a]
MLRHHLPPLYPLLSQYRTIFARLWSSRSETTDSNSNFTQPATQAPYATSEQQHEGSYVYLENQPPQSQSLDARATYELGQLKSVQTFIRKGGDKQTSDDKIHLRYDIELQQTTRRRAESRIDARLLFAEE